MNEILKGHALDVLKSLPDASIDCVMTSPPYYGLRNYGNCEAVWDSKEGCQHNFSIRHHKPRGGGDPVASTQVGNNQKILHFEYDSTHCSLCGAWKGQLGLEPSWKLYIRHLVQIFAEVKRVLKPTGSFWLNMGDTYAGSGCGAFSNSENSLNRNELYQKESVTKHVEDYESKCLMGIPWRLAFAMIDDGWILRNSVIWHKPNCMPSSVKDRLSNTYEFIFHFIKNSKTILWQHDKTRVWSWVEPEPDYRWKNRLTSVVIDYVPDDINKIIVIAGKEKKLWQRFNLWEGFDCYYDLDAIRVPHSEATIDRITQKTVFEQMGGSKQDELRGIPASGNASRCNKMVQSLAKRIVDAPVIMEHSINKDGHSGYFDNEGNPLVDFGRGKNPGDVFATRNISESHIYKSRDPARHINPDGSNPGDYWEVTTRPYHGSHFATFPPKLCVAPILATCPVGGVVMDIFAGSGTVLAVAKALGRNYLGIEIVDKYIPMMEERLKRLEWPLSPITKRKDAEVTIDRIFMGVPQRGVPALANMGANNKEPYQQNNPHLMRLKVEGSAK